MAFINDEVFDQGLDYADTNGTRIDICSAEPTTYAQATSTGFHIGDDTTNNAGMLYEAFIYHERVLSEEEVIDWHNNFYHFLTPR